MVRKPTAEQIKAAREAAGLTQSVCAEMFGYKLRSWQAKEDPGAGNRGLSAGEYAYLQLLADQHPSYTLAPKHTGKQSR
ncbi:hypothetical protein [Duganella vulcania]|uniref:XRE family transcriptional regulator n=1 Tax=Duganella vulcania TaxID=2692166 RepID=A0A845GGG2_9BURK|nr:hypothetical protein [Duganella vulcania]MYM92502.1 hypothetical protein [Duganella vulcania]